MLVGLVAGAYPAYLITRIRPIEAMDKVFYDFPSDQGDGAKPSRAYTVIGVVPAQNFLGFHNRIKPMVFLKDPKVFRIASVRVNALRYE